MPLGLLRFTNALGGTGDFLYPGPTIDMQSPATAGAVDGTTYTYYAQSFDMTQWEKGNGVYTAATGKIARTTVVANSSGTTAKINFSTPPQVFAFERTRERLSADRSYYVATTGSDSNDGLTASTPFLTLQKAADTVSSIDLGINSVTVNVANGTYASFTIKTVIGSGSVTFVGNPASPSSCVISDTASAVTCMASGGTFVLNGFRVASSTAQDIQQQGTGSRLVLLNMEYAGTSAIFRVYVTATSFLNFSASGTHKILGGGIAFLCFDIMSNVLMTSTTFTLGANITVTSAFVLGRRFGYLEAASTVFNLGAFAVTGPRYSFSNCSGVAGTGAAPNYFPGSSAGATDATSFYS